MAPSRRGYLQKIGLLASGGVATAGCLGDGGVRSPTARADRRSRTLGSPPAEWDPPNVVLIVLDDAGIGDFGAYGDTVVHTPNVDAMADSGRVFSQAYAGCCVCAPSRSTLFDGQHVGETGVRGNAGGLPLPSDAHTLSRTLSDAGYVVGGFGKWGLGDLRTTGVPTRHGFDTFFGYYDQVHAHDYYPSFLIQNGVGVRWSGGYSHYEIVKRGMRFMAEHESERFFCYAPWVPPHDPFRIPPSDPAWKRYEGRDWPEAARKRAAMITMVDRQIGVYRKCLRELDIAEETLVIVTADNGPNGPMDDTLDANRHLRGHKRSIYEGGLRVPLVAEWPGVIESGTTHDAPVYFPDLYPTIATLCGAETLVPGDRDGRSFARQMIGLEPERELHDSLYWEWWNGSGWSPRNYDRGRVKQAVRSGDWKLVRSARSSAWELFDLSADPTESNDLASSRPRKVEQLKAVARREASNTPPGDDPGGSLGRRYRRPETFRTPTG